MAETVAYPGCDICKIVPMLDPDMVIIDGEVFDDPLPGKYLSSFERRPTSNETARLIAATLRGNLPEIKT